MFEFNIKAVPAPNNIHTVSDKPPSDIIRELLLDSDRGYGISLLASNSEVQEVARGGYLSDEVKPNSSYHIEDNAIKKMFTAGVCFLLHKHFLYK